MHMRYLSVFVVWTLAGCGDSKGNLSDSLNPTNMSFPSGFDGGDESNDEGPGQTDTTAETGGSSPTSGVATLPPETSAETTSPTTMSTHATQPDTDPTNSGPTSDPSSDPATSDPSFPGTDEGNSDPTNFLPVEDGPAGECDVWKENCPAGQKCMPYADDGSSSWNALKCVPVMGTDKPGEACTVEGSGVSGLDSCVKHAICFGVDGNNEGTCVQMCNGTPANPSCPNGTSCAISNDDVLIVCLDGCDPLTDSCASDEVCVLNNGSFVCVIDASGDEGQQNDGCEYLNACDPGLVCLDPAAVSTCQQNLVGCCTEWCDVTNPGTCPNGLTCTGVFEPGEAPIGYENIGYCGG